MLTRRFAKLMLTVASVAFLLPPPAATGGGLSDEIRQALKDSKYVYIASQRKDGTFGSKAEIWFFEHDGAVWVGTSPSSWRARRIKAGRTAAKVYVGKPDGLSFDAVGSIVQDAAVQKRMFETYAKKYPGGWPQHESRFREGFADGSRVMIKYVPTA